MPVMCNRKSACQVYNVVAKLDSFARYRTFLTKTWLARQFVSVTFVAKIYTQ